MTYLRSSSFNAWGMCPMQFYLSYTLGLKPDAENGWTVPKPQHKADKGSVVHKALELLAQRKLCEQEGVGSFVDAETTTAWSVADLTPDAAIDAAYAHYSAKCVYHEWVPKDYRECRKWMFDTMAYNGGQFNPLLRRVIWPEKYFDFVIDEPWAAYAYTLPDGRRLEGKLALKGSIDLVCGVDGYDNAVELCDWKTGERKCWITGEPKDYDKLRVDPQLRLYHYALCRLLPDVDHILITIVYARSGGPFSLPFDRSDLKKTEAMLAERFAAIRDCVRPPRIRHSRKDGWKCNRLCAFGMNDWGDTGQTACDHIHARLLDIGIDKVTAQYGRPNAFSSYGDGGGKSDRDT